MRQISLATLAETRGCRVYGAPADLPINITAARPWEDRAACAGKHELFDKVARKVPRAIREAADLCESCPVRAVCDASVRHAD